MKYPLVVELESIMHTCLSLVPNGRVHDEECFTIVGVKNSAEKIVEKLFPNWIATEQILPKEEGWYYIYTRLTIEIAFYSENFFYTDEDCQTKLNLPRYWTTMKEIQKILPPYTPLSSK